MRLGNMQNLQKVNAPGRIRTYALLDRSQVRAHKRRITVSQSSATNPLHSALYSLSSSTVSIPQTTPQNFECGYECGYEILDGGNGRLMAKLKKGFVEERTVPGTKKKIYYARMNWTDAAGKRHYIYRRAKNKTDAGDILRDESQKIATANPTLSVGHSMSVGELITYYRKN